MDRDDLLRRAEIYSQIVNGADVSRPEQVAGLRRMLSLIAAEAEPWALCLTLALVASAYRGRADGDTLGGVSEYVVWLNAAAAVRGAK